MEKEFDWAKEYIDAALPNLKVELLPNAVDGQPAVVLDSWVNIWPSYDTVGKQTKKVYNVDVFVETSANSRWEPPDGDVTFLGKTPYFHEALELAITAWFKNDLSNFFEAKAWAEAYNESLKT